MSWIWPDPDEPALPMLEACAKYHEDCVASCIEAGDYGPVNTHRRTAELIREAVRIFQVAIDAQRSFPNQSGAA